jgi:hypothetical protein
MKLRTLFASDILSLSDALDKINEKDARNSRASALIRKSVMIYLQADKQYEDMIMNVGDNAFLEYKEWYHDNIFSVVAKKGGPKSAGKADDYGLEKYFNGLNKDVFEELQKLIAFLMDPKCEGILSHISKEGEDPDIDFANHTKYFLILAHSIFIACLEGGEFMDRLEKIYEGFDLSKKEEKFLSDLITDYRIHAAANDVVNGTSNLLSIHGISMN